MSPELQIEAIELDRYSRRRYLNEEEDINWKTI
jgi:hypothetical protein